MSVRAAFKRQAVVCPGLGSDFMGQLMALLGERLEPGDPVSDRVLNWQGDPSAAADSVPLRLAGALHALRINGLALTDVYPPYRVDDDQLWRSVHAAFDAHQEHVLQWLDLPPQTNEVRRAAAVHYALAHLSFDRPLRVIELGASAGLNLRLDHFRTDCTDGFFGAEGSDVHLTPEWRGLSSKGHGMPEIAERVGIDLSPIDATTSEGRLRLLAYVWPDQPDRLDRTDAAIKIAKRVPAQMLAGDAAARLEEVLAQPTECQTVVFHTIAWQYFPEATKARGVAAMAAHADITQIGMEADDDTPGAGLSITHWPDGSTQMLARVDYHGRWLAAA